MPAADAFRLLAAMAGGEDGEAALRSLVEATYDAIGWPGERAVADLEALRSVLIESPRDLRCALAAGHQYQVGVERPLSDRAAQLTDPPRNSFPSPSSRSML